MCRALQAQLLVCCCIIGKALPIVRSLLIPARKTSGTFQQKNDDHTWRHFISVREGGEIETFLKWLYSSKRDLPAHFQASAKAGGAKPSKPQTQDSLLPTGAGKNSIASQSLLLSAKRQANSNLADTLIREMNGTMSRSASEYKKVAESYLKHSYASYLRLNCAPQDLKRVRAWKYGADSVREVEALCQAYLAMGNLDGIQEKTDFGDWSGGSRKSAIFDAALSKCRTLYPTLSGNFFSKKSAPKTKKGSKDVKKDVSGNVLSGNTNAEASSSTALESPENVE